MGNAVGYRGELCVLSWKVLLYGPGVDRNCVSGDGRYVLRAHVDELSQLAT
jgi:hypothetical protein